MKKILFFAAIFFFFFATNTAQADTEITQHLNTDTVWTLAGSPYIINPAERDLYIERQVTLTIEPGVVVKFASKRALDVRGKLKAIGTPDQHIVFTSIYDLSEETTDQPAYGDWYGIKINGVESHLEYTQIKYAGKEGYKDYPDAALVLVGSDHVVHHNFITQSDSDCLHLYVAFASIQNNLLQKCEGTGISTNQGRSEISYNIIQNNEGNG